GLAQKGAAALSHSQTVGVGDGGGRREFVDRLPVEKVRVRDGVVSAGQADADEVARRDRADHLQVADRHVAAGRTGRSGRADDVAAFGPATLIAYVKIPGLRIEVRVAVAAERRGRRARAGEERGT